MRRLWSTDELDERWSLSPGDLALLVGHSDAGKLGLACQLAFWRVYGCFPEEEADLAPAVIAHLAAQVGVPVEAIESYAFSSRSMRRHRKAVLDHLAVRDFDGAAEAAFRTWFRSELLPREPSPAVLEEEVNAWFARERTLRPGGYRLDRLIRSIRILHDDAVLASTGDRLDHDMRERLDALLADDGSGTAYTRLSVDPGKVGLESLLTEIAKLEVVRDLKLPADLFAGFHPNLIKRFRRRASVESAWELRRHPARIRLPLLAFYCVPREVALSDVICTSVDHIPEKRYSLHGDTNEAEEDRGPAQQPSGAGEG
ncbi:MAG: DUF4158 domain-containing protein [Rhodospirillales bacterium]